MLVTVIDGTVRSGSTDAPQSSFNRGKAQGVVRGRSTEVRPGWQRGWPRAHSELRWCVQGFADDARAPISLQQNDAYLSFRCAPFGGSALVVMKVLHSSGGFRQGDGDQSRPMAGAAKSFRFAQNCQRSAVPTPMHRDSREEHARTRDALQYSRGTNYRQPWPQ